MPARVTRLQEIEPIDVAGVHWRPLRRTLGISAFGTNAYSADAGEQLIEPHVEGDPGADEELYLVVAGHARFTVAGEDIDAPAGTVVFIPDATERREAVATADGTLALTVGAPPRAAGGPSAWEFRFAAAPHAQAGDWAAAYATAAEALEFHPDDPKLHYDLACFAARAGRPDAALGHLRTAFAGDPRTREWAAGDDDLAELRQDPDYPR